MQSKDQTIGSKGALRDHKTVAAAMTVDQAAGTILGYASLAQNSGCANQAGFIHETASAGILTISKGEVWMLSGHGHARADIVTVGGKMAQCKALTNKTAIKETAKRIAEGYYGKMDIVVPRDTYDALLAEGVPAGRMVKMPYSTRYVKSVALKMGQGYGSIGSKIATSISTGAITGACFATAFSTAACAFEVAQGNMTPEKAAVEIVKSAAVAGVNGTVYNTAVTCTSLVLKEMGYKTAAAAVPGIGTALMVLTGINFLTDGMLSQMASEAAAGIIYVLEKETEKAFERGEKHLISAGHTGERAINFLDSAPARIRSFFTGWL